MDQTIDSDTRVDGRTARRDRNRIAVLDAVVELFGEDNLTPGVHEVADRSGVSLRSVYRYFEDLDDLIAAAIDRQLTKVQPLFRLERVGEGPLPERLHRFCDSRLRLFEAVRVVYQAARVRASADPALRADLTATHHRLAEQTRAMFASELASFDDVTAADRARVIDLLTQLDSLEHLRHRCGLGRDETVDFLRRSLGHALR